MIDIPITKDKWRLSEDGFRITTSAPCILEGSKTVADFSEFSKTREETVANAVVCCEAPEMLYILSEVQGVLDDSRVVQEALKGRINEVLRRIQDYRKFL
jgi:hypothetical protein